MLPTFQPRRPFLPHRRTPAPAVGHRCVGVAATGGGYCAWHFDYPLAHPGDCHGLTIDGQPPDDVQFSPGDDFIVLHYTNNPAPGSHWAYAAGPNPQFEDGLPGLPGSGVCTLG